ncbi:hypothetical protein MMC29_003072 [Sticta canariensis]|nr:hypothetical protein [Sticta canariensis]
MATLINTKNRNLYLALEQIKNLPVTNPYCCLAIDPSKILALLSEGNLTVIGKWYPLMDEFVILQRSTAPVLTLDNTGKTVLLESMM